MLQYTLESWRLVVTAILVLHSLHLVGQPHEFRPAGYFGTGSVPGGIALGDYDGDGKTDLAVANQAGNTVSILLGNGDGSFRKRADYAAGNYPLYVVQGDFDQDGVSDLAVTDLEQTAITVLIGNGDGTFGAPVAYATAGCPYGLAAGDVNGDGTMDLVAASSDSYTVSVLLGNGDGTFQPHTDYSVGKYPVSIALADLNGDGLLDIAVANLLDDTIGVLIGNGNGTFQDQVAYAAGLGPVSIVASDFNGDGHYDLATANDGDSDLSVFLGNGDGTLQPQVTYATNSGLSSVQVAAGDFNGDGIGDLVTANYHGTRERDSISVFLGRGDGTFATAQNYMSGSGTAWIAVGEFNGDAAQDLAVSLENTDNVMSFLNTGGTFTKLSSSVNPSKMGEPVTFSAYIRPSLRRNELLGRSAVRFFDGVSPLGVARLESGAATLTVSTLSSGTHNISAYFLGNRDFNPRAIQSIEQIVLEPKASSVLKGAHSHRSSFHSQVPTSLFPRRIAR